VLHDLPVKKILRALASSWPEFALVLDEEVPEAGTGSVDVFLSAEGTGIVFMGMVHVTLCG
jgi:hypothetical protein